MSLYNKADKMKKNIFLDISCPLHLVYFNHNNKPTKERKIIKYIKKVGLSKQKKKGWYST